MKVKILQKFQYLYNFPLSDKLKYELVFFINSLSKFLLKVTSRIFLIFYLLSFFRQIIKSEKNRDLSLERADILEHFILIISIFIVVKVTMEILIWFTSKWLNKNLKFDDDKVLLRNFHTERYYFYFSLPGIFLVDFFYFDGRGVALPILISVLILVCFIFFLKLLIKKYPVMQILPENQIFYRLFYNFGIFVFLTVVLYFFISGYLIFVEIEYLVIAIMFPRFVFQSIGGMYKNF